MLLLILLKMSRNIHQSNITLSNYPELHWILLPQNWRRVSLFLRAWGYVSLGNHHIVFSSQSPDGLGRNLQYKSTRRTKQSDNKANIDIFSKNAWNFNTLNVKNFEYTQKNHTYFQRELEFILQLSCTLYVVENFFLYFLIQKVTFVFESLYPRGLFGEPSKDTQYRIFDELAKGAILFLDPGFPNPIKTEMKM